MQAILVYCGANPGTKPIYKETAEKLRRRIRVFRRVSGTKKQIFLILVTTFGLVKNQYSIGLIDNTLILDDLF